MPPIDSYLYVLLSYILLYTLVSFAYKRFKSRFSPSAETEQPLEDR